jgi:hypothetical protein
VDALQLLLPLAAMDAADQLLYILHGAGSSGRQLWSATCTVWRRQPTVSEEAAARRLQRSHICVACHGLLATIRMHIMQLMPCPLPCLLLVVCFGGQELRGCWLLEATAWSTHSTVYGLGPL